jgi:hypothetical protein
VSKRNPTPVEEAELKHRCPYCGAKTGEWCIQKRTLSVPAGFLHTERFNAAVKAGNLPLKEVT